MKTLATMLKRSNITSLLPIWVSSISRIEPSKSPGLAACGGFVQKNLPLMDNVNKFRTIFCGKVLMERGLRGKTRIF
jgi:hypothetical protein